MSFRPTSKNCSLCSLSSMQSKCWYKNALKGIFNMSLLLIVPLPSLTYMHSKLREAVTVCASMRLDKLSVQLIQSQPPFYFFLWPNKNFFKIKRHFSLLRTAIHVTRPILVTLIGSWSCLEKITLKIIFKESSHTSLSLSLTYSA
jgi:hypothetical protein